MEEWSLNEVAAKISLALQGNSVLVKIMKLEARDFSRGRVEKEGNIFRENRPENLDYRLPKEK